MNPWQGKYARNYPLAWQHKLGAIPGLKGYGVSWTGDLTAHAAAAKRLGQNMLIPDRPVGPYVHDERLRPFQVEGVKWVTGMLQATGGAMLCDEMGLGKSAQALAAWRAMNCSNLLIVCPAMVRESWREQVKQWLWAEPYVVDSGKAAQSCPPSGVVISSYDLLNELTFYGQFVVFDEAQAIKSRIIKGKGAARVKAARNAAACAQWRLVMTGTEMWDRPRDLWGLLDVAWPGRFGHPMDFDEAYCEGHYGQHGGWENRGVNSPHLHELKARTKMLLVKREKREVAKDLPPLTMNVQWLPPNKKATAYMKSFMLGNTTIQQALEACLEDKHAAAIELATAAKKFLLVTWMKKDAQTLHAGICKHGFSPQYIDGTVTHTERARRIKQAASSGQGIVATIDSLSAGVDGIQHVTSFGIFHSFHKVPTVMAQTVARLDRIGQLNPVQWTWLALRESIEEPMVNHLIKKMMAQVQVTGGLSSMRDAFNDEGDEEAQLAAMFKELTNEQ